MRRITGALAALLVMVSVARGADDPMVKLKDFTLSYFTPLSGSITRVDGKQVVIAPSDKDVLKQGMRIKVLRDGAPFIHPVTKEVLGKVETTVGKVEVREVSGGSAAGSIVEGEAREGDKVRIPATKVRVLFVQDKTIDWYLADDLYRKLKATGRIELVDTNIDTDDEAGIMAEGKRLTTEVALVLTARAADKDTLVRERLYWVSDGARFADTEARVDFGFIKELKVGEEFFSPRAGEAVMMFDLPFSGRFVASADVDGDGKQEIIISTGSDIRVYTTGVDLKLLWEIKGSASSRHIWLDTVDLNGNGKDEIVVTSMKNDDIVSTVYELEGAGFKKVWETKNFLRQLGNGLIGQAYSASDGFAGDVFSIVRSGGEYKAGEKLSLPKGINIYDFVYLEGTAKEKLIFAYDDAGFLNLYDDKGLRLWRSAKWTGGFATTFKKPSAASYVNSGEWSVKDRLTQRHREVLAVQRNALTEIAKGLGYKSSTVKAFWWNGFSMEETVLIDGIKGNILDYAFSGDRVVALTSPMMGLKFENILKGESPLGTMIFIYSLKGR
ncbi:MAG: VCBS repeat-containing protein [Nitrospiraceae bacterium]|nr:VCBS repeat-containing protein [Nitrospiraceae bacterium]